MTRAHAGPAGSTRRSVGRSSSSHQHPTRTASQYGSRHPRFDDRSVRQTILRAGSGTCQSLGTRSWRSPVQTGSAGSAPRAGDRSGRASRHQCARDRPRRGAVLPALFRPVPVPVPVEAQLDFRRRRSDRRHLLGQPLRLSLPGQREPFPRHGIDRLPAFAVQTTTGTQRHSAATARFRPAASICSCSFSARSSETAISLGAGVSALPPAATSWPLLPRRPPGRRPEDGAPTSSPGWSRPASRAGSRLSRVASSAHCPLRPLPTGRRIPR